MKNLFFVLVFILYNSFAFSSDIAVVTMAIGEEYIKSVSLGIKNKQEYCKKHGYDFICLKEIIDSSRAIPWSKIPLIQNLMKNSSCKWIFWTDADSLIMNMRISLESIIDKNFNLIISTEHVDSVNSGQFLIKNCPESREFLKAIYSHAEFSHSGFWEQDAFVYELNNTPKFRKFTKFVPQKMLNCYPDIFESGDFILHFFGVREPKILESAFYKFVPKVIH